ncbi:hypothetical protein [Solidesulfovibrio sp. C21]|uniref:hypothetical protein n=1 Tax=Solidesulfovibrio sp. C21 TaxID=3398613 RepID=UPI0039FC2FC9
MIDDDLKCIDPSECLMGKNTVLASKAIAEAIVLNFGEIAGDAGSIEGVLLPKGRSTTWEDMDYSLVVLAKKHCPKWDPVEKISDGENLMECFINNHTFRFLEFIDNIRFLIEKQPHRKSYGNVFSDGDESAPRYKIHHHLTCQLCWRAIPWRQYGNNKCLCRDHDLPSRHGEYRRRIRMIQRVYEVKRELRSIVPTPVEIRQKKIFNQNNFYLNMCLDKMGYFPFVAQRLLSLGLPLESSEDVLRALEYSDKHPRVSSVEIEAWDAYFADFGAHFWLNYPKLLLAEAWLRVDEEFKHGGSRRSQMKG